MQMLENCGIAIEFIQTEMKIKLVGIDGQDIFDGNQKLILGLIWSIILNSVTFD